MDQPTEMSWSQQDELDPSTAQQESDFNSFLNFDPDNINLDDIGLDFSTFADNGDSSQGNQNIQELANALDTQHLASGDLSAQQQSFSHGAQHSQPLSAPPTMTEFFSFNNFQTGFSQSQSQQQYSLPQEHAFRPHGMVPPTPNSVEMHADRMAYMARVDSQSRLVLEQHQRYNKDNGSFTPLVSPAFTPHGSPFAIVPENTAVPRGYYSPLTSPALEGQQQNQYFQDPRQSSSSIGTSPVDINDVDMLGEAAVSSAPATQKTKSRRNAPRSAGPSARVRQSPIVKPNRRKATLSSSIPPKEVSDLLEEVHRHKNTPSRPTSHGQDSSGAESISPEPLSESVMGPPPKPSSVNQSPNIIAQNNSQDPSNRINGNGITPATPASLLTRHRPSPTLNTTLSQSPIPEANLSESILQTPLDDLFLPAPAADSVQPSLTRLDTRVPNEESTPQLPARKTQKLGPLSTPSGANTTSALPSPSISAATSPSGPVSFTSVSYTPITSARNKDTKAGARNKKRNSVSSTLVSPALRPKISPSIQPKLPGVSTNGSGSDATHALLLASKSNYQHILEGTTLPGVKYPEALSSNLTSKRTSHKIAEQGRRQRMNIALGEMQELLPSPSIKAKLKDDEDEESKQANGKGRKGSKAGKVEDKDEKGGSSKAATVECAIEYIKTLLKEKEQRESLLRQRETEIENLRRRLGAVEGLKEDSDRPDSGMSEASSNDDATVERTIERSVSQSAELEKIEERSEHSDESSSEANGRQESTSVEAEMIDVHEGAESSS